MPGGDGETPLIFTDRNQLSLNRDLLDVDIWQFERHLTAGSPQNLQYAAALYRGDLLAHLSFEQETLDAWCAAERTRLRDRFFETLATLTSHYADTIARLDAGDVDPAIRRAIATWLGNQALDAVVWTALPSRGPRGEAERPAFDCLLSHLKSLKGAARARAEEYIRRTPGSVRTRHRMRFEEILGWIPMDGGD